MLKIANWNLERIVTKQRRVERIKDAISEISSDVWILTETHKDVGPENFTSVTSIELDSESQEGECWSSIWSYFPIIQPFSQFSFRSDTDGVRCTRSGSGGGDSR